MFVFRTHVHEGDALVRAVVDEMVHRIEGALDTSLRCDVALSGGTTPKAVYEALAASALEFRGVRFWQVDERAVPIDHPRSNARMIQEALAPALDRGAQFLPFFGAGDPEAAAHGYGELLEGELRGTTPTFDLLLLGIGEDGHTASLFPGDGTIEIAGEEPVALAVPARGERETRLSLSATTILAAREILVLATGAGKKQALERLYAPLGSEQDTPSRLLRRSRRPVDVYVDAAASPL